MIKNLELVLLIFQNKGDYMKKNIIIVITLSVIIVILLNYIIFSIVLKTSVVEFLKLPVLGSLIVALVSIVTVYLTNSFNLKKVKIETSNAIYKMQFEKEFNIYIEIWEKLFKVKKFTLSLLPIFDDKLPDDLVEREREYIRRYKKFVKTYNSFSKVLIKYKPFYNEIIYTKLVEIRKILYDEGKYFNEIKIKKTLKHSDYLFFMHNPEKVEKLEMLIMETSEMMKITLKDFKLG